MVRKYKRNFKRKFNRKRKPSAKAIMYRRDLSRPGTPYSVMRKLRYYDEVTLSPGATGIPQANVYRLNSVFDPDFSGTGSQPRFFDQHMAMYDKFVVVGALVTAKFINLDTSNPGQVGLTVQTHTTTLGSNTDYIEAGNSVYRDLGILSGSKAIQTLRMKWSGKKWFNKPNMMTEYDLSGDDTSNPTTQAYLHAWVASPIASDTGNIRLQLTIDYIVVFKEPLVPDQS